MNREERHRGQRLAMIELILSERVIDRQESLVNELKDLGFAVTQGSVSRDLQDLGVAKVGGRYVLSLARVASSNRGVRYLPAGPNLLVIKTPVGAAQLIGVQIDQLDLPEVIGTIAGDDTIFLAIASQRDHKPLIHKLSKSLNHV